MKHCLKLKLYLAALLFCFFFTPCNADTRTFQKPCFPVTQDERIWLQEFFRDLLFNNPGAYTLYGSKPISIAFYYHNSADRFKVNYEKWKAIKDRFSIRQYLFGEFPSKFVEGVDIVFFVNVESTLRMLLNNYADFRRVLGRDFDPFEAVFEVENPDSSFWRSVMQSHALLGILLGFGQDNAWFFEWKGEHGNEQSLLGRFVRSLPWGTSERDDEEEHDPQHFLLPVYTIYGQFPNDELLEQSKLEQEAIIALYKGRDEVDLALKWLTR